MPLPRPNGRQREVLYLPAEGHTVVLGTAGSGKTTLAIHRAAYLANPSTPHAGPTLLLTFNRTLVTYLKHLSDPRLIDVTIEHYHKFARGYLSAHNLLPRNSIVDPRQRKDLVTRAVSAVAERYGPDPLFARPIELFLEEVAWLSRHGIHDLASYGATTRTGRIDARIERRYRPMVWEIYEMYRYLRARYGYVYDWDDLASAVSRTLDDDDSPRLYKHIVVDEGQDLSPEMIRSLTKAIPPDSSFTFFGDVAQQIYGHRMTWRSAGIRTSKIWHFKDNYRNTRQISRLALAIAEMPYYRGAPDIVEPVTPTADGPLPTVVECSSVEEEARFVAEQATAAAENQQVAVLVRRRSDESLIAPLLGGNKMRLHGDMKIWRPAPGIFYGTYHSAKGLEFDLIILPFCDKASIPDPDDIRALGEGEAEARDGRLLYVGVTRAKTALIITYTGVATSLLPDTTELYHQVKL